MLTDFYPPEGKLATQVILNGSNFGDSKENVKVFFNDKEASVISVKDDRMLVLAPKRASTIEDPECLVKVQVHEQIEEYKQTFDYYIQTTVTTLVGGSTSAQVNPTGTIPLSEAQFRANIDRCICVDQDKNVFFLVDNDGKFAAFMLNEEADKLISLKSDINALFNSPVLGYNSKDDIVYQFWANRDSHEVYYFDPKTDYAPTTAISSISWDDPNFPNIEGFGVWAAKCNFTMGPDGKMYSRMLGGNLVRIDVENARGENLTNGDLVGTKDGSAYGLVFDPQDENVFYFSNNDKHCIYKYIGTSQRLTNRPTFAAGSPAALSSCKKVSASKAFTANSSPPEVCGSKSTSSIEKGIFFAKRSHCDDYGMDACLTVGNYPSDGAGSTFEQPCKETGESGTDNRFAKYSGF